VRYYDDDKRQAFTILHRLAQVTEQYSQKGMTDKINAIIDYQTKTTK
jgi:hypothetical protein